MNRNLLGLALLTLAIAGCADSPTGVNSDTEASLSAAPPGTRPIPGRFIVTLQERTDPSAFVREHGVQPEFVYTHALNGFAGAISDAARQGLLRDNRVVRVEPDAIVTAFETETNATWGLDRLDQRALPLSTRYTYRNNGRGVRVYIIDTGIRLSHVQFGGRAVSGFDAVDGGSATDCNGHGTHVAGTVGGSTYGVAQAVTLVGVRVLNCNGLGTVSGVIAGVDWVTRNAIKPAVANISLGSPISSSLDAAVKNMIDRGVASAIAAGNESQDACRVSPARVAAGMTIAATARADQKPSWSNFGSCVDWFAPGVDIKSAWHTSNTAVATISGTSMATPHTAGVAALYLQSNPTATAKQVRDALYAKTTKGIVASSRTANNHLLFTNY
jgi:subtilisin family serine protease